MRPEEIAETTLHGVIEQTLENYVLACEQSGYHPDKCGYIGQVLDKARNVYEGQRIPGLPSEP